MSINLPRLGGHLACLGAYLIFGFNIVFSKDIALSGVLSPMQVYTLRALGACAIFWAVSLFMPREKVCGKDLLQIFLAAMVGLFLPQLSFLKAITVTTSIDVSILGSITPIMTMFVAAIFLKEPITLKKAGGVLMSFLGVMLLIFNSVHVSNGADTTSPAGVLLMIVNGLTFALYLGIFRPLIARYSVITFMKWAFLFSVLVSLPFEFRSLCRLDYAHIEPSLYWQVGYVILFATFFAYLFIPIGQKHLRPTIVSMYSYVQPIVAVIVSIYTGIDSLSWQKVVAAVLVFAGVAIVNRSRAAGQPKPEKAAV